MTKSMRLIQIRRREQRRVALVEEPQVQILDGAESIYALVQEALVSGTTLTESVTRSAMGERLDYDDIYRGNSEWSLLPAIDHPAESARCLVSGTGLTHLGSAEKRQAMHTRSVEDLTDSMKMFRWGLEGGRPEPGSVGVAPEWFYKGNGAVLRAHGEPLEVPPFAEDGGEEAEIAGVYAVDPDGKPWRIGMAIGNEFSDHISERRNYLNLAASKLRTCSLGPELAITPDFGSVAGRAAIERGGTDIWSRPLSTGEAEMCHSLANIEHHHFKFPEHRRPGDLHVHFLGADRLSFGDGVKLQDGDLMVVSFDGFGRALRNPLRHLDAEDRILSVGPLG